MLKLLLAFSRATLMVLFSRSALVAENLALRQQLAVLSRGVSRPGLRGRDRAFWVVLRHLWSGWREVLVLVKPETVIAWHRQGFRLYWTWKSRRGRTGRPRTDARVRVLVKEMAEANLWGAPRIHGELLKCKRSRIDVLDLGAQIRPERSVGEVLLPQPGREQRDLRRRVGLDALQHVHEVGVGIHAL